MATDKRIGDVVRFRDWGTSHYEGRIMTIENQRDVGAPERVAYVAVLGYRGPFPVWLDRTAPMFPAIYVPENVS